MSGAYYNENDPFATAWLRELIKSSLIAPGEVDERSIEEVKPDDLRGFTQCHFFAGIGVWSYALRNAGWSDDLAVWTGSCPCQGFSASGQRGGFSDKRHLWPTWFRLISECRPFTVFGEQVASKDGLAWLDVVSADMEGAGYAIGATDICAAGFGAPHIRQRLYFVADTVPAGRAEGWTIARSGSSAGGGLTRDGEYSATFGLPQRTSQTPLKPQGASSRQAQQRPSDAFNGSNSDGGNTSAEGLQRSREHGLCEKDSRVGDGCNASLNGNGPLDGQSRQGTKSQEQAGRSGASCDHGDAEIIGRSGRENNEYAGRREHAPRQTSEAGNGIDTEQQRLEGLGGNVREWRGPGWLDPVTARSVAEAGATRGFWSDCDWWYGRDGKYRPIGQGISPLTGPAKSSILALASGPADILGLLRDHGDAEIESGEARTQRLRGYGNAIVAQVASAFISSYMEIRGETKNTLS